MAEPKKRHQAFEIKDCALAALATGQRAQNLKELRDRVRSVNPGSIYYHFWGGLLKPRFDDPEYNNDFASWVRHALHDKVLADRLGMIDPTEYPDMQDLRRELLDIIEERLDESEHLHWCGLDQQFYFITSQIVVFNTRKYIKKARELVTMIPAMTASSVFYHFIDARRRTFGNIDDFRSWLYGFDGQYVGLCERLSEVDPFFSTLTELRQQLADIFTLYFKENDR
ncbi:MAG: hypothetical protein JXB45_09335 [Candidatus Krumholzibacteriota bacterium]|nr:hypothetical protein [Candidatus Krumholzibacteriota bacterium]